MNKIADLPANLIEGEELSAQSYLACEEGLPMEGFRFEDGVLDCTYDARLDVRGCLFERCRFPIEIGQKVDFKDCVFIGCDFSSAQMDGCAFRSCDISGSRWTGAFLAEGFVQYSRFADCAMDLCTIGESKIQDVLLWRCKMDRFAANSVRWTKLRLGHCSLRQAEIQNFPLKGLDLRTCDIEGITLEPSLLRGAIVTPQQALALAGLLGVVIKETD